MLVPHDAAGAHIARQTFNAELAGLLAPALLLDAVTVVAELLGNAVRHARPLPGGVIRLSCRIGSAVSGTYVHLRVTDGGAEQSPVIRAADGDSVNGRGLAIVSALARRWGVEHNGVGQSVWAELGTPRP
jgi:anti-sigma regulatory factor (Ser/Thr protein kinase)